MKNKFNPLPPLPVDKILLHTCCAPCSSAIIEYLLAHDIRPTLYFCNPNIYPHAEYTYRKDECVRYALDLGLSIVDEDYDHQCWLSQVKGLEDEPERGCRCAKCFTERLMRTAAYASREGFKVFTTTLATSRWKRLDQIFEAGAAAQKAYPEVIFWAENWRKGGLSERRSAIIKEKQFYNQQYCGCEFSLRDSLAVRKQVTE